MSDDNSTSGARMTVAHDPLFRRLVTWFWGVLGIGFVTCIGVAANNLYQLNLTVARAADNSVVMATSLADHEARLRALERERGH